MKITKKIAERTIELFNESNPNTEKFGGVIVTKKMDEFYVYKFYIVGVNDWHFNGIFSNIGIKITNQIEQEFGVKMHFYIGMVVRFTYGMSNELVIKTVENDPYKKEYQGYRA